MPDGQNGRTYLSDEAASIYRLSPNTRRFLQAEGLPTALYFFNFDLSAEGISNFQRAYERKRQDHLSGYAALKPVSVLIGALGFSIDHTFEFIGFEADEETVYLFPVYDPNVEYLNSDIQCFSGCLRAFDTLYYRPLKATSQDEIPRFLRSSSENLRAAIQAIDHAAISSRSLFWGEMIERIETGQVL